MSWVQLDDNTWAEEATPDPRRVLTSEDLQQELERKQQEVSMYENELNHMTQCKETLETEILELSNLLNI